MTEKQLTEKAVQLERGQSPFFQLRRRFRRQRLAVWSLRVLYVLVFIAVFGDFIANEKPIYCSIAGQTYFPVLKQYAVDLGISKWSAEFYQKEWSEHAYEAVVFPPIPYSPKTIDSKNSGYKSPFAKQNISSNRYRHWLGTDKTGHDIAAGMVAGTRIALLVGLIAMSIATLIGVLLGSLAGYFGDDGLRVTHVRLWFNVLALFFAWFYGFQVRSFVLSECSAHGGFGAELAKSFAIVGGIFVLVNGLVFLIEKIPLAFFKKKIPLPMDIVVMRLIEVIRSIPGLLLLLSIVAVLQSSSILYIMAVIGLLRWTGVARFLRPEMLRIRNLPYIEAARALGFSHQRIILQHALPNALTPVLITIAFDIAAAILLESALSFLGFGIGAEGVTWGQLLSEARKYPGAWWLAVFPGGAIFLTVTIFNLIGEGLSDAMKN